MIAEALEKILRLQRPEELKTTNGIKIYNDGKGCYENLIPTKQNSVSNIESLIEFVLYQARIRGNLTGSMMIVSFDDKGADFTPADTKTPHDYFHDATRYNRQYSEAWKEIERVTKHGYGSHSDFLEFLKAVIIYLDNAKETYKTFEKLTYNKIRQIESSPNYDASGKRDNSISESEKISTIPKIKLLLPVVKASKDYYDIELDVNISNRDLGLAFNIAFPEKEQLLEQMVLDEIGHFKEKISEILPELLILNNF